MHDRSSPRRKCWPGGETRRDGVGVACLLLRAGCLAAGHVQFLGASVYVGAEDSEDSGKQQQRAAEALSRQARRAPAAGTTLVTCILRTVQKWWSGAGQ